MPKNFKFIIIIFILILSMFSCEKKETDISSFSSDDIRTFLTSKYFEVAPKAFQYKDLAFVHLQSNQSSTLKNISADIIILNFWAIWCKPCLAEMPEMDKLQKALDQNKIKIVAINYGDSKSSVEAFQEKYNYKFTIGLAEQNSINQIFNVQGLPTTFILTKKGTILGRLIGPTRWSDEAFITFFKKLQTFISEE